jgi:hypothetical protein
LEEGAAAPPSGGNCFSSPGEDSASQFQGLEESHPPRAG